MTACKKAKIQAEYVKYMVHRYIQYHRPRSERNVRVESSFSNSEFDDCL